MVSHEHHELYIVFKICNLATSLRSSNNLFQNIDWEFSDAPLDGVVWSKIIANLLTTASQHIILAIFTVAGLKKLSPAV